jgi:hypothetical protein
LFLLFRYDWSSAGIPPLTSESEEQIRTAKATKDRERKKAQKKRQKDKEKNDKLQQMKQQSIIDTAVNIAMNTGIENARIKQAAIDGKQASIERSKTLANMSDREKRALAAEKRYKKIKLNYFISTATILHVLCGPLCALIWTTFTKTTIKSKTK